jgi:hypothetical protein
MASQYDDERETSSNDAADGAGALVLGMVIVLLICSAGAAVVALAR